VRGPAPSPSLLVAAAAGGVLGALLRWGLGVLTPDGSGFPWTTFAINVSGSFLLAALPALAAVRRHPVLPVFLGTGVLGGYTTLSTYAEQGRSLLADGRTALAGVYLAGTLLACLGAVVVAHRLSSSDAQHEFEDEEGNE
jgi:CrcB protein